VVVPAGPGTVKVTPAGGGNPQCSDGGLLTPIACSYSFTPGSTVTLEAAPRPTDPNGPYSFVRWSDEDCGTANPCALVVPDDPAPFTIAAFFSPAELRVKVTNNQPGQGNGVITGTGPPGGPAINCGRVQGTQVCGGWYPFGSQVTLTVASGAFTGWHRNCDGLSSTCTLTTAGYAWINPEFDGNGEDGSLPQKVSSFVKVAVGGATGGAVTSSKSPGTGEAIACPGTCIARFYFGEPVQLTAAGAAVLSSWGQACQGAGSTCSFAAGTYSPVKATFSAAPSTSTQATTSNATTTVQSTTSVTATSTSSTTTSSTTTTGQPNPKKLAQATRFTTVLHGRRLIVALTLQLSRRAGGRASLVRGKVRVATRRLALAPGKRVVQFRVRHARSGQYLLRVALADAEGRGVVLDRRFRIR